MNTLAANNLLKTYKLRSTPNRQTILHLFLRKDHALSHADIESEIADSLDRVTVYRTLKTFLNRGLIHKVLDDAGGLKYALCVGDCSVAEHHHNHLHFKCVRCGQTNCLDVEVPEIRLPRHYSVEEINVLVQGVCSACGTGR
ncbi:MAG TPA: transcriptional repressor [Cyclobacteriaceae bacterium]|jgi:Fur family ferric uptake transcriptional regulator